MDYLCISQELLSERSDKLPVVGFADTTLAYTSLFLKQEAERWDIHGNQIVKVTKEMADKIYQMTQYLKRKGPIQVKVNILMFCDISCFGLFLSDDPLISFVEQRCFCNISKRVSL